MRPIHPRSSSASQLIRVDGAAPAPPEPEPCTPPGCCLVSDERRFRSMALRILQSLSASQVTSTPLLKGKTEQISSRTYPLLLHYNIGEAAGHNDTQSSVSDVYITSITARWKAAKQECNDKSALPFKRESTRAGPLQRQKLIYPATAQLETPCRQTRG